MKFPRLNASRIIDLLFCLIFMPALILLGPAHEWPAEWPMFFAVVCVYCYGCYFLLKTANIPRMIIEGRYRMTATIAVTLIAITWLLCLYPHPEMDFYTPNLSKYQTKIRDYGISMSLWMMFAMVTAYALTTSFIRELYERQLHIQKIENQKNKAELAMFKAQISPHFLFNTLNSLYSLVIGTSEKAEEAFIKFTDMLRYTYETVENDTVALRDELEYIRNYIDLQSLRLNNHTKVDWHYDVDDLEVTLPPLIFLTFIENAFKYGSSTGKDCSIVIEMSLNDGKLEFTTHNSIMRHSDEFRTSVPVGIENCRARLNTLFPDKHSLVTSEKGGFYNVTLNITLR